MNTRKARLSIAVALVLALAGGAAILTTRALTAAQQDHFVAYFDNSNGLFTGDEVRILGVPVGTIDRIEPQADKAKISFSIDAKYRVPADVRAAVLSPQLITSRAIQLTPAYTAGPTLADGATIPLNRTAVPVEWDDLRQQLAKLTDALQPTRPGGVSTLGAFINTSAANLRGQGANIRQTIIRLSQTLSTLGDHSDDTFGTIKNLSTLVGALSDSASLLSQLNTNLASATGLLADDPDKIGRAINDLNSVVGEATTFLADHREALGTTTDKLASISQALHDSTDDLKQTLHIAPNLLQNYLNIFNPSQAALTGILAVPNFSNPITFLCGAIQAASRLNAEQSAKLCVQYLAPIIKNRQYNSLPLGENLLIGASARPNELTYSEDWLRPDYVPAQQPPNPPPDGPAQLQPPTAAPVSVAGAPLPAEAPTATDPASGLPGLMTPPGTP
jgi:phospholipid/cholesterol/gamma-HCH transport system substrate-binding protein